MRAVRVYISDTHTRKPTSKHSQRKSAGRSAGNFGFGPFSRIVRKTRLV